MLPFFFFPLLQSAMATNMHPFHHFFPGNLSPSHHQSQSQFGCNGSCSVWYRGWDDWTDGGLEVEDGLASKCRCSSAAQQFQWLQAHSSVTLQESEATTSFVLQGTDGNSLCVPAGKHWLVSSWLSALYTQKLFSEKMMNWWRDGTWILCLDRCSNVANLHHFYKLKQDESWDHLNI